MQDTILELIYPNVCGFCDTICKDSLCEKCKEKLKEKIICNIDNYESDDTKYFTKHAYLFKYEESIRNKILDYKFNDKAYLYKTFSKILLKNEKMYSIFKKYDIIIPVPIHKKRMNERGYNQSELIAKEIAKNINNLKLEKKLLIKIKNTKQQSKLSKSERYENSKDVYILKDTNKIKDKNIILFDDIYTTGSTANECSKLLKLAGAKDICVLTLAKD